MVAESPMNQALILKRIGNSPNERLALQRVLEAAPNYSIRVSGLPPGPNEAQAVLTELPPGMGLEAKFVFGFYLGSEMVGCADLIRGYPNPQTVMLGLLLFSEKYQGQGFGKQACQLLEQKIQGWSEIDTLRIGVVASNGQVISFWEKMGFQNSGVRKPYENGAVVSETLVFEKRLGPKREI